MNTHLTSTGYRVTNLEDLKEAVPSAFATTYDPRRTEKYSFFSTEEFLKTVEKVGWVPFSGKQQGSSVFSRHVIRLENPQFGYIQVKNDKIKPQLLIDNSHNGCSSGKLHLGLFRLVCSNGLVVGIPGMSNSIRFIHMGIDAPELMKLVAETAEQYREVGTHITMMKEIEMSEEQKFEFASNAMAIREPYHFLKADKTVNLENLHKLITPQELYKPLREEDDSNDLWSVFNVIQERTVNGLYERKSITGRKSAPKVITNVSRHLDYNKKLWNLAETFMPQESLITI